jgi:hypothetical protein
MSMLRDISEDLAVRLPEIVGISQMPPIRYVAAAEINRQGDAQLPAPYR